MIAEAPKSLVLALVLVLSTQTLMAMEKDPQKQGAAEKDIELKKTPKEICLHFLELLQEGDLQNCLRYVKESQKEGFAKSFTSLRDELKKTKISFSREVRKSDKEHQVYFHFDRKEDDFDLELIDGVWKIVSL
jgi:hypothetical protein